MLELHARIQIRIPYEESLKISPTATTCRPN